MELEELAPPLDQVFFVQENRKLFESFVSTSTVQPLPDLEGSLSDSISLSYDTERHAKKCPKWHGELAYKRIVHFFWRKNQKKNKKQNKTGDSWRIIRSMPADLHLARIGRPDHLPLVNCLARAITKWNKTCGARLARLVSSIHCASGYSLHCDVENISSQCKLGLFQHADCARDLADSKSTSGQVLCIFGPRTFLPFRLSCKKETAVSHSVTEADVISLEARLRREFHLACRQPCAPSKK